MPGIAGVIRKARYDAIQKDLDAMLGTLRHTPESNSGTYVDESAGLWVGWVCHRDAYSDCMPLVAKNEEVVIVFHGEHYADSDEGRRLKDAGYAAEPGTARYLLDL